ncbi:hypothetical protein GGR57DRAFT_434066 [Xylariaceae sp. FL1272]|nr:hypothetical protein GGR57DRAFT_434066 [Xylariaceae sp. FL1272]
MFFIPYAVILCATDRILRYSRSLLTIRSFTIIIKSASVPSLPIPPSATMLRFVVLLPLVHCALVRYDSPAWMQSPSCGIPCISSTIVDVLHCTASNQTCVCPELDVDRGLNGCIEVQCTEQDGDKAFDAVSSWCEGHTTAPIFNGKEKPTGNGGVTFTTLTDSTTSDSTTATTSTASFLSTKSSGVHTTITQTPRLITSSLRTTTAHTSSTRISFAKTQSLTLIPTLVIPPISAPSSSTSCQTTSSRSGSVTTSSISPSSTPLGDHNSNNNTSNGHRSNNGIQSAPSESDPTSEETTKQPSLTHNEVLTLAITIPLGIISNIAAFTYFRYFKSLRRASQSQTQPDPDDLDLSSDTDTTNRHSMELVFYELSAEKDPVELEANEKPRRSEIEGIKRVVRESGLKLALMFGMKGGAKERDEQKGNAAMRLGERKTWG